MTSTPTALRGGKAPRSAGIAGLVFSALFTASLLLPSVRPPEGLSDTAFVAWFRDNGVTALTISALYLASFAGIAFLWFIGVIRHRIGDREDRLFATVFLGTGILFVGMYWSAAAQLASLVSGNRYDVAPPLTAEQVEAARSSAFAYMYVLAARAAAAFMLVSSSIMLRSGTFPRPLALVGLAIAVVLLLSLAALQWVVLLFPAWVALTSAYLLFRDTREPAAVGDA